MDMGLAGKTAVVTGGSRGIGRATAFVLAEEGCRVGICARGEEQLAPDLNTVIGGLRSGSPGQTNTAPARRTGLSERTQAEWTMHRRLPSHGRRTSGPGQTPQVPLGWLAGCSLFRF